MTANASGSIRVIRGGRSSQFFLSPKLSLQLIPDDLLVVESKQFVGGRRNGNTSSANGWQGETGQLSAGPAPNIVQIGLVNLISRPVVLDLPSEQANLAKVLSLLHQPVTDKGEITIFKPGSGLQSVTLDQASEANLATGMVLMFDPATVNSAVLPRLPKTIRPDGTDEAAIARTSAESDVAQTTVPETVLKVQGDQPGNPSLFVPQATSSDVSVPGSSSLNPESIEISPTVTPMATTDLTTAARDSTDAASESNDSQPSPETADESPSENDPAAAPARSPFFISSLALLTGIVVCCLGILLTLGFKRRVKPVAAPALPEPIEQHDDSLEALISGALPVVEEPLTLAYQAEIFGRPLEMSRHRTDLAQELNGPHYLPQPSQAASQANVVTGSAQRPAPGPVHGPVHGPADRKVRVDSQHSRGTASVLDRAVATFEGEQP